MLSNLISIHGDDDVEMVVETITEMMTIIIKSIINFNEIPWKGRMARVSTCPLLTTFLFPLVLNPVAALLISTVNTLGGEDVIGKIFSW
jgi:hypothetical protein